MTEVLEKNFSIVVQYQSSNHDDFFAASTVCVFFMWVVLYASVVWIRFKWWESNGENCELRLLTDWVDVHAICFDYWNEGPLFNSICLYLQILQAN